MDAYISESCRPVYTRSPEGSILPQFNAPPPTSNVTSTQNTNPNTASNMNPLAQQSTGSNAVVTTSVTPPNAKGGTPRPISELYWCVDKAWLEPSETWLCIEDAHTLEDDRNLCSRLNEQYRQVRGFRGRFLSWKTCLRVEFTSVSTLEPDHWIHTETDH